MFDLNNLIAQLQQIGSGSITDFCIIDGNIWSLDQVEIMSLNEYAEHTFYSMPLKFYKYFPNTDKDGTNYSLLALESNEVYLSNPCDFDDVFDSEISVQWEEFEAFRIKTYASWARCHLNPNMSLEDTANVLLQRLFDLVQKGEDIENAFDMKAHEELEKLQAREFVLRLKLEQANHDMGTALKNVITKEYELFIEDLKNIFRISCFTTAPMSQLMWGGSYANEHRGFCLEYTVIPSQEYEDILHNIRPVIYSKKRHPVTRALLDAHDKNWSIPALRDLYLNGALRKSIDWAYQNEWRLLLPPQTHGQKGFTKKFFPITKVYLGNRMPADKRKEIITICKRKGIPYIGVTRSLELYEMQECKDLCENCLWLNNLGINKKV